MTISPLVTGSKPTQMIDTIVKKRNPTITSGASEAIEDFKFRDGLPTADELPDSDDKPVDKEWSRRFPPAREFRSELQEVIAGLLKGILLDLWRDRTGWLFAVDMGFYYDPDQPAIAPDAFLSLGVEEYDDENLRPSYVLWDEKVIPLFALEIISKTAGKEHTKKLNIYRSTGILYYLVYAPLRKKKAKFQLYKLIEGEYVLQSDGREPYWMPEVGLAIGVERQKYRGCDREWLFWYDENSVRYLTPTERAEAESQRAAAAMARQRAIEQENSVLRKKLQELGIDPDALMEINSD
jgi:Uma2 family endonuclease